MKKIIKNKIVLVSVMIIISIILGVFIFNKLNDDNINYIISQANNLKYINLKNILYHIVIFGISFTLSFIGIGAIFLLIYLFFEGITIGFVLSYNFYCYKIGGIGYTVAYILIYKFLLIFLTILLILKFIKLFKNTIKIFKKQNNDITKTIYNCIIIFLLILFNDLFLIIFGSKILNIFSFLIN